MPKTIEVVYEHGVFRPLEKVDLPEKTKLRIKIDDIEDLTEGILWTAGIKDLARGR